MKILLTSYLNPPVHVVFDCHLSYNPDKGHGSTRPGKVKNDKNPIQMMKKWIVLTGKDILGFFMMPCIQSITSLNAPRFYHLVCG